MNQIAQRLPYWKGRIQSARPEIELLIDIARKARSPQERISILKNAEKIIYDLISQMSKDFWQQPGYDERDTEAGLVDDLVRELLHYAELIHDMPGADTHVLNSLESQLNDRQKELWKRRN